MLGYNDEFAAQQLRLNSTKWDRSTTVDTKEFLLWIKKEVMRGNLVTIGVYTNEFLFYCTTNKNAGDSDYDHIVSVIGIDSTTPNDFENFNNEDILYFSDHGLWDPYESPSNTRYIFNYTFLEVMGNRQDANRKDGRVYTLPNDESIGNYGLSISGIMDLNNECLPISIIPSQNYEEPEIRDGSNTRPTSFMLNLTVTISNLTPSVEYILYKYNNVSKVPTQSFNINSNSGQSISQRDIVISSGTKYIFVETIESSDRVIYRCVRKDGL